jgi:hypothetical protein
MHCVFLHMRSTCLAYQIRTFSCKSNMNQTHQVQFIPMPIRSSTQHPVQGISEFFHFGGGVAGRGVKPTSRPHTVPTLRMCGATPPLPPMSASCIA